MVLKLYGYMPAWGVPDISPYVTKIIYYLKITKTPFEYFSQDLTKLDEDSPYGKLPYIVDDDGTKVGDSNQIIEYMEKKHGVTLDKDLSDAERAVSLAFERLIGEHLYWSGIIQPRWRMDEGFEIYVPVLVQGAEVGPELRAFLDAFRKRVLDGFNGQGMGRRDDAYVLKIYTTDIDALSEFLGQKKFFMGDKVHAIDAHVSAILRHFTVQPQKWKGSGYVESQKNLADYLSRMQAEFNI